MHRDDPVLAEMATQRVCQHGPLADQKIARLLQYPIIAALDRFKDPAWRRRIMDAITGLPISSV